MKSSTHFVVVNTLGIAYTILYLIGFFKSNSIYYSIGAVGMFTWIRSLITGDSKKIISFFSAIVIITIVFLFFNIIWFKTVFWVTFAFALGQFIPSLFLIFGRKHISSNNDTHEKIKLFSVESFQIIALLVLPFLLQNMFKV